MREPEQNSAGEVPEWAWDRVMELCGIDMDRTFISVQAFARYIAAHEPEPVDPLRDALERTFGFDVLGEQVAELRARGVTMEKNNG